MAICSPSQRVPGHAPWAGWSARRLVEAALTLE
jgi:hypothetical protein